MKNNIMRLLSRSISVLLVTTLITSVFAVSTYAENNDADPITVVSLGDSYSSGEGIPPFYGQTDPQGKQLPIQKKITDNDWLAHRSPKGWPSLLKFPDSGETLGHYKVDSVNKALKYNWYFRASSGATTEHFTQQQEKTVQRVDYHIRKKATIHLPAQLDVFKSIPQGTVDYVTLTIGGNDVDFAGLITTCAIGVATYTDANLLDLKLHKLWSNFDATKADIKRAYTNIRDAAGSQAVIIVAGYPKLLDRNGKGALIDKNEASKLNSSITKFNNELENIVTIYQMSGMNIHFVDVEAEFDRDGGHQAYSDDSWLNGIMLGSRSEDLSDLSPASSYSMHPNELGAQAYARCVNAKIKEIENTKQKGTLSGKILKASDKLSPISGATISVYKDDKLLYVPNDLLNATFNVSDASGNYKLTLSAGNYRIIIKSPGYAPFTAYATVTENSNTYMETFLLVEGDENETGVASGNIYNALTGNGLDDVTLTIRKGWNNSNIGDIIETTKTGTNGSYSVTLPIGNYTMYATKDGFISTPVNIIVQKGTTDSQNGTMTPTLSGNNYRIVLTWGANPRDLDSHVVGTLSNGNSFHTYYSHKSQYDGNTEVCNLDVDDTSSYGPETITLNATTDNPYYYYIYRYGGSGTLSSSNAQVRVYQGGNLLGTFNVPTDQGNGDYWNVFAIVNGKFVVKDTITSDADINYASVSTNALPANFAAEDNAPKKKVSIDKKPAQSDSDKSSNTSNTTAAKSKANAASTDVQSSAEDFDNDQEEITEDTSTS